MRRCDDATGRLLAALFREQEDAQGYFLLVEQLVRRYGRPLALYHDRHSIFRPAAGAQATREEVLAGRGPLTQFGRLVAELGIASIAARSPQAKGRVERLFGTLQDRLVVELRLAGAATLEAATAVLAAYLPRFNAQFAVPAAQPGSAYRPLEPAQPLETICCFKHARVVAADNTVTFGSQRLQLRAGPTRRSYAHATVAVHERLDGSLAVYYGGQCVQTTPAPAEAPLLRARATQREPAQAPVAPPPIGRNAARPDASQLVQGGRRSGPRAPSADHPWRRPLTPTGAARGQSHCTLTWTFSLNFDSRRVWASPPVSHMR